MILNPFARAVMLSGSGRAAPSYALDAITATLVAGFSMRRLRTGYTGPAIRVRRSSDNTELDINFLSNGDLDTTSILNFVGAGVGANGFMTKWYDQSGNVHDLTQPTVLAQPRIAVDGAIELFNTRPTMRTNRLNGWFMGVGGFTGAQANTRCSVLQILDPANAVNAVFFDSSNAAAGGNSLYMTTTTQMTMFRGTNLNGPNTIAANSQATSVETANGASSTFHWNGTQFAGDAGANGYDGLNVGCKRDISLYGEMLCPEVMLFSGVMGATDRNALIGNQKTYFGTP